MYLVGCGHLIDSSHKDISSVLHLCLSANRKKLKPMDMKLFFIRMVLLYSHSATTITWYQYYSCITKYFSGNLSTPFELP